MVVVPVKGSEVPLSLFRMPFMLPGCRGLKSLGNGLSTKIRGALNVVYVMPFQIPPLRSILLIAVWIENVPVEPSSKSRVDPVGVTLICLNRFVFTLTPEKLKLPKGGK